MNQRTSSGRALPAAALLQEVSRLLDAGEPQRALSALGPRTAHDPLLHNARGVCLMRLGRKREAVELFHPLALIGDSIQLDLDRPLPLLVNYATALLLEDNVTGCLAVLDELNREEVPAVAALRGQIARWHAGLSRWQRFLFFFYGTPARPVPLDGPPGMIVMSPAEAPKRAA